MDISVSDTVDCSLLSPPTNKHPGKTYTWDVRVDFPYHFIFWCYMSLFGALADASIHDKYEAFGIYGGFEFEVRDFATYMPVDYTD